MLLATRLLCKPVMATSLNSASVKPSGSGSMEALKPKLKGVVFDMDGTLTVPVIDFALMKRKVLGDDHHYFKSGSTSRIDILHEIEQWSPERQQKAYSIITDMEREAHERLQIMPGALELCEWLDSRQIRRGLITRNIKASVDLFHSRFGMKEFSPALSREFRPYKPNPAPLLHICTTWAVSPSEVMMVGDSVNDDIACGKGAGAITCLLDESGKYTSTDASSNVQPDFKVNSLLELSTLLQNKFELTP
ncbi:haloacid dehalogenase-like hydrolase domain-containing protein At2g33255 isoform X3 [Cryptomeria japonica]|uniref:haloacid dehalogenase-like hydrolase domain-containing protein At2g33255 isoform X3 n=1 Tax=Cryptomeria japonica TaxID=3369 RepID=UPI0025AC9D54|nr:haloacid dehalogenase-like hydrolase domain-containing protein At2g33255 isoform X3 [Cryptomeria japonica]